MASKKSINSFLSEDTLARIFEYLSPLDIHSSSVCDNLWQSVCAKNDQQLWEKHSVALWDTKSVNVPDLDDISILSRIKTVPLIQIKRALMRVDITRCIEKIDFQRMFLAYLLFRDRSAENSTALRIYYPEWALKIKIYKATYWHALRERYRTNILLGELCAIRWRFNFKLASDIQQQQLYNQSTDSRFRENFTMESDMQQNAFNWQFVTTTENGKQTIKVQIEQYPPMTCSRLADGSWTLENHYGWFEQLNNLPAETLPLL